MASKRRQILSALKTKLQGITTGNGYNTTVKKVSYGYIPISKVSEYPTICMIPLDGIFTPLTNCEYTSGAGRNTTDGWPVAIISYVQNTANEEALSDSRENIIEDIAKCILADHNLALASFFHNAYYISCEGTLDIENSLATVTQIFSIKYDFNKSAP